MKDIRMTSLPGRWALTMSTPIGRINAGVVFTADGDALAGTATGKGETVELTNIRAVPFTGVSGENGAGGGSGSGSESSVRGGERVTWSQAITKPLRLNLDFDVVVTADEMRGHSRAGRLPQSAVTGRRVSA
jgi:hypothetical protein